MAEIQTTQTNGGLPPQISKQLRQLKKEFEANILPEVKARESFESKSRLRKRRIKPFCRNPNIKFSPFAMTLGNGLPDVRFPTSKSWPVRTATIPSQTGQLISVFIIAIVTADPPVYVLQKIQKKSAPGFPGGGIENGETILQAAAREFKEESNEDPVKGTDITPCNPLCIGKFTLDRALSGEEGAVVLVEIPESETANLQAGGGIEEGEMVEELFFMTFDEVSEKAENRTILPNSVEIWDLYCNYLVNTP